MDKHTITYPKWLIALYSISALVLGPWIIYLGFSLPERHVATHWDAAWVGFDLGMLLLIGLTALMAYRRSARLAPTASALATVLLIDSWFDVMTAKPGTQQLESLLFAVIVEVPLALITFALVHQSLAQVNWDKQKTIVVGKQAKPKK